MSIKRSLERQRSSQQRKMTHIKISTQQPLQECISDFLKKVTNNHRKGRPKFLEKITTHGSENPRQTNINIFLKKEEMIQQQAIIQE